jgi:curli production assembly/transport component CsgE
MHIDIHKSIVMALGFALSGLAFAAADSSEAINGKAFNGNNGLEAGNKLNGSVLQEQYGGVVVDQTITVAGQDFYQNFNALWREKPLAERFAVAIREQPSVRWGNRIFIEYRQRRVFEAVLPPNRSNIKAISEQAVEIAYQNMVDTDVQRLLFRDQDIGPDEF